MKKSVPNFHKETSAQLLFFLAVGVITFIIDVSFTSFFYSVANFPAYIASTIGFLLGFLFSFPVNRKRVFRHTSQDKFSLSVQVALFISLSVLNLVITAALVEILVNTGVVSIQIAKVGTTGLIAIWNFIIFKAVIFSKLPAKKSHSTSKEV